MFIFQGDIGSLLRRVKAIGKSGISVGTGGRDETQGASKSSADELLKALDSMTLQDQERSIKEGLDKRGITDPSEREKVLVRYLAVNQIAYAFEIVNSTIWASQVALLQSINTRSDGVTKDELKPFYDLAASAELLVRERYPFENYLGFLRSQNLLTEKDGRFFITYFGRDFLVYLVHRGHTGNRYM